MIIFKVTVTVLDINDNSPQFPVNRVSMSVSESAAVGTSLPLQPAHDPDVGPNGVRAYELTSVTGQNFDLLAARKNDGSVELKLVVMRALDREQQVEHVLEVIILYLHNITRLIPVLNQMSEIEQINHVVLS